MPKKSDLIAELKAMLNDVLQAKTRGESYARLARAHGYVDGYMRALLESGIATRQELLTLVADERSEVHGPATREVTLDDAEAAA
jgi:hypothetical protein